MTQKIRGRQLFSGFHAKSLFCLVAVVLLSLLPMAAWSQSASGTISGTVTDAGGSLIPGANVFLQNVDTGVTTRTVSNRSGFFNFAAVAPGTYNLTIQARGFEKWVASGIAEHQG